MSFRMARVLRKVTEEVRLSNGLLIGPAEVGKWRSSWTPYGMLCFTCGRVVPKERVVEVGDGNGRFEVLSVCHGQEEHRIYDLGTGTRMDDEDFAMKLRSCRQSDRLFDPLQGHTDPGFAALAPANDVASPAGPLPSTTGEEGNPCAPALEGCSQPAPANDTTKEEGAA